MHEIKRDQELIISSEKNFGIVMSVILLIIGIYQFYFHQNFIIWLFISSIALFISAIFFPKRFYYYYYQ